MKDSKKYFLDGSINKLLAVAIDGVGYTLIRRHRGGPINKSNIRKILLIRLDHIGDVLMTSPAFRALRKACPEAEIHLLVKESTSEAVKLNPHLNRIITFNAPWTTTGTEKATAAETLRLVGRLRRERYDCVIDFRADLREALLALFTGAPCRLGYGARGGGFCFTHPLEYRREDHEIRRAINLLSPLEAASDGEKMDFIFSPSNREKAVTILCNTGIKTNSRIVGIHPGAASPYKRWTEEGFAHLGDLLIEGGYQVILMGAGVEKARLETIVRRMKTTPPIVCGVNLRVLGALISRLDCLVCNDSAPSHIAQAVRTRAIVLYGPTHDKVTGPLDREKNPVVRNPVPCSPCWLPGTKFGCKYDLQCWKGLEAGVVLKAIKDGGSRRL